MYHIQFNNNDSKNKNRKDAVMGIASFSVNHASGHSSADISLSLYFRIFPEAVIG